MTDVPADPGRKLPSATSDAQSWLAYFETSGHTDGGYLLEHHERFCGTLQEFLRTCRVNDRRRILDVGAHWLHQSVVWAAAGFDVTAVDLPELFNYESVRKVADDAGIRLLPCESLARPSALEALAENSFDVILVSEVIEHLAFNPVTMWQQIYRVMAPGSRLVVTTPNVYRLGGGAWQPRRFLSGRGFGISVEDIIGLRDLSHHWKEYSRSELCRYFALLSPDFRVSKALHVPSFRSSVGRLRTLRRLIELPIPILRGNLHVEVDLPAKTKGIVAKPHW